MCDPPGRPQVSVGLCLGAVGTSAPTPVPSSLLGRGGPETQPHWPPTPVLPCPHVPNRPMRPAQVPHSPDPRCRGAGWAQVEVVFRSSCSDLLLGGALTKTPLHSDSALSSPPPSLFIPGQAGSIKWQEPVMQDSSVERDPPPIGRLSH